MGVKTGIYFKVRISMKHDIGVIGCTFHWTITLQNKTLISGLMGEISYVKDENYCTFLRKIFFQKNFGKSDTNFLN